MIMQDLVGELTTSTVSDDILSNLTTLIQNVDIQSLSTFLSNNFNALFTLEQWVWKMLSQDSNQWMNRSTCVQLIDHLTVFNKNLIFTSVEIDSERKASLFIPQTKEVIDGIFEQLERSNDDNDPYFILISLWLDNLSYLMYEDTQFLMSSIIIDMEYWIACKFVMTDQYKFYLTHLQQSIFTAKQLFYIKTCSFSLSAYLVCKKQKFPFTSDDIFRYLGKEYLELIQIHSFTVQSWSKEFCSCITQIISFICTCCWWSEDREKSIKTLLPSKEICHEHVQSLIRIINNRSFYPNIQLQRSNDETMLIDSILGSLLAIVQVYDLVCYMRSQTELIDILLPLAETSRYDRISLSACVMLGGLLSDEHLKELKMTSNVCEYFFSMLEHAWNHPEQYYQRTSVPQLLRGFLNLVKNDTIQQKTADTNRVLLLIEMCDQYPVVFDILWALSFNHDIQQQLRTNTSFMTKLSHLKQELNNAQMRKITHGILWNLESSHKDRSGSENDDQATFDIMISYSHKDKHLCKQIYDELIKCGYRVWIDFDQMHGNVMDAMAQAIERSNTILICMSEQYRRSNYCRAEAHYAFQRQLRIVPVLLEKHYRPDGWLLFLIGQLLYVDFTKHEFSNAIKMLFKELEAPILRQHETSHAESADVTNIVVENMPIPLPMSIPPMISDNILEWTESEVQDWLIRHNLIQMSHLLSDYTGSSLVHLNRYLTNGDPQQILKLLQEDSLRRTSENLSVVELAHFQTLVNKQLLHSKNSRKATEKNSRRYKWHSLNVCQIM